MLENRQVKNINYQFHEFFLLFFSSFFFQIHEKKYHFFRYVGIGSGFIYHVVWSVSIL